MKLQAIGFKNNMHWQLTKLMIKRHLVGLKIMHINMKLINS